MYFLKPLECRKKSATWVPIISALLVSNFSFEILNVVPNFGILYTSNCDQAKLTDAGLPVLVREYPALGTCAVDAALLHLASVRAVAVVVITQICKPKKLTYSTLFATERKQKSSLHGTTFPILLRHTAGER